MKKNLSSNYANTQGILELFDTDEGFRRPFAKLVYDAHMIICLMGVMGSVGCQPYRYCASQERYEELMKGGRLLKDGRRSLSFKDRAIRLNDRNHRMVISRFIKDTWDVIYLAEDLDEIYEELKDDARFKAALHR